jgi:cysteinyl-tRNA synthetase
MQKQPKLSLTLYNTLGRKQVPLGTSHDVTMYVCGITPYDYAHLGHGRCYVTFDLLFRLLTFLGSRVTYCRNFTDIDDKLIKRAELELNDSGAFLTIAQKYITSFHEDMEKLGCKAPQHEPRVTNHIPTIIRFIEGLISQGKAYATESGDVYFKISAFPSYGKLSQRTRDDLKIGARVAIRSDKNDPLDFALWKGAHKSPGWESPWGFGRPGWHIECSAMAAEYLGKTIDIHGGGMDLIFPHHENEIAQSEALHNEPFARVWIHNAFVRVNQEKMSKSLGNFLTLRDACNAFDPMVLRYYYLIHHYRNPLDFKEEDIESARKSYQKLCHVFEVVPIASQDDLLADTNPIKLEILKALCDDLNVAKAIGIIFESVKESSTNELSLLKAIFVHILGLTLELEKKKEIVMSSEIEELIAARLKARSEKDWATADSLRARLKDLGYEVQDKK